MELGLKGMKAIVTGGTRGIGRAIAETLASEGCNVAVCARHAGQVAEVVASLKSKGVTAAGAAVDVADGAALRTWVEKAAEEMGGLDIYVANVSAMQVMPGEAAWRASFDVDIMGTVNGIEAAIPKLTESGKGSIVIIGTVASVEVSGAQPYGAVKAALLNYAKGLSIQHAKKRIRANTVSPGSVFFEGGVWDMIKKGMPDRYEKTLKANRLGRMASPQDVANAAVFLASPAAEFITGTNLVVDGALTSRVQF